MSVPKTVWVREGADGDLWIGRDEEEILETESHTIGEYHLVATKRRQLHPGDAK